MRQALKPHPDSRSLAVNAIEVDVARLRPASLQVRYFVTGRIEEVRTPAKSTPARTDELWKHTCFEAFLRPGPGSAYFEFNFSPSTQWAAYRFTDYRKGMAAAEIAAPEITTRSTPSGLELHALLQLDQLTALPADQPWQLALSAVIEEASGAKSYWALKHAPGKADFHHPDCFALKLPSA